MRRTQLGEASSGTHHFELLPIPFIGRAYVLKDPHQHCTASMAVLVAKASRIVNEGLLSSDEPDWDGSSDSEVEVRVCFSFATLWL